MSGWRNWLARLTVNQEVMSSILILDVCFCFSRQFYTRIFVVLIGATAAYPFLLCDCASWIWTQVRCCS